MYCTIDSDYNSDAMLLVKGTPADIEMCLYKYLKCCRMRVTNCCMNKLSGAKFTVHIEK